MTASRRRLSQEFTDELCREVVSTANTTKAAADESGVGAETLRNWLKKYRATHFTETSQVEPTLGA